MDILQENITKELGFENLPENEKEEIYLRISKIIYQNIMIRVVEILEEKDQDEFIKILDEDNKSESESNDVFNFLKSKINNLDNIVEEEVVRFKKESVDVMKEVMKQD